METTELTANQLRSRMAARRVQVKDLAREAGMLRHDVTAILNGRQYCGEERRKRLELAIIKLELDKEPEPEEKPAVVFRISQL